MFKRYVYIEGLTTLLGSNGKYLINNDGQIKDIKGNDIEFRRDDEGHRVVHCSGWDGEREYRVIDLVAVQFKGLYIPADCYNEIVAFVIDSDKDNVHAVNIGYRFRNGKLEFKEVPGFYYVPGMTSIAVNVIGEAVSTITAERKNIYTTRPNPDRNIKGGYRTITVFFKGHRSVTAGMHRALCLTFKNYPDNVDSMTVNHKNGIPGDDWLDNLEWATHGENNKHAYENDLKTQHMRVLVRDVISGNISEHYSISEAARVAGITSGSMYNRVFKSKFGEVFGDGTQIKLKSDDRDWIIPSNPEIAVKLAQPNKKIIVRDCMTLKETYCDSIVDAERLFGAGRRSISYRFKVDNGSPLFGYQFKTVDDLRPWKDFTKEEYISSLAPNSFELDARNLLTGELKTFSSVNKAAAVFGRIDIQNCPDGKKQPLLSSGWQLKRRDDVWEEVRDFEEVIYKLKREVMCKNEKTGEIILSDNAKQLAGILGLDPKAIRRVAYTRGNELYHGHRFRLGISNDPWPTSMIQHLKKPRKIDKARNV